MFQCRRQTNRVLALWIFVIVELFTIREAHAQPIPIGGKLYGEPVLHLDYFSSKDVFGPGPSEYYELAATTEAIYTSLETPFGFGSYEKTWTPPSGTRIVGVRTKRVSATDRFKGTYTAIVILDNGDVHKLNVNTFDVKVEADSVSHLNVAGSPSWKQIFGDDLYALSNNALFVSRDNGASWQTDQTGLTSLSFNEGATDSRQRAFLATSKGLYEQDSASSQWSLWTAQPPGTNTNFEHIFITSKDHIYIQPFGTPGLLVSTDAGGSWTSDMTAPIVASGFGEDARGDIFIYGQNAASSAPQVFVQRSGNATWNDITSGLTSVAGANCIIHSMQGAHSNGSNQPVVAATSSGFYYSTDGGSSWTQQNVGIQAATFGGIQKLKGGAFMASTSLGVWLLPFKDSVWQKVYPAQGYTTSPLPLYRDHPGSVYITDNSTSKLSLPLLKSSDAGKTWLPDTLGNADLQGGVWYIDEFGVEHFATSQYGSSFHTKFYSKTPPGSWSQETGTGFPDSNRSAVSFIASDRHGKLYAGGAYLRPAQLFSRPISGGNWSADTTGLQGAALRAMVAAKDGTMYATDGRKIFVRKAGSSWQSSPAPGDPLLTTIDKISADSGGYIVVHCTPISAGSADGIFFRNDTTGAWIDAGFKGIGVSTLESFGPTDSYVGSSAGLFAVTPDRAQSNLTASLATIDFGTVAQGRSKDTTVTLTNTGSAEVDLNGFTITSPAFHISSASPVLPAFASQPLLITFAPQSSGPFSTDVVFQTTAATNPTLHLTGNAASSEVAKIEAPQVPTVFPNPADRSIRVSDPASRALLLTDALGRTVRSIERQGSEELRLDTHALPSGNYFLRIEGGDTNFRIPVIIQH